MQIMFARHPLIYRHLSIDYFDTVQISKQPLDRLNLGTYIYVPKSLQFFQSVGQTFNISNTLVHNQKPAKLIV